jgi:hypothetical protein
MYTLFIKRAGTINQGAPKSVRHEVCTLHDFPETAIVAIMDINVPKIDTIISIIVSLAAPDQIILFGSYARGDNREKI